MSPRPKPILPAKLGCIDSEMLAAECSRFLERRFLKDGTSRAPVTAALRRSSANAHCLTCERTDALRLALMATTLPH